MKRSETVGNGRKQSETWSGQNLSNPHFFNKHFRATQVFFWRSKGVQGETVGNSRRSHLRFARQKPCFYIIFKYFSWTTRYYTTTTFLPSEGAISDCFQPFPLGLLWTLKKKLRCAEMFILRRNAGWTNFGLIMFPTVSDRFRPFHFFERLFGPIPFTKVQTRANHDA